MTNFETGMSYLMFTNRDTNSFFWNTKFRKEFLEESRPKTTEWSSRSPKELMPR